MTDSAKSEFDPNENIARFIERSALTQVLDSKGRPVPDEMSDRDILVEVLLHMRTIADVVEEMSQSPMVKAMQGGGNPFMAMLGRG